jgi:uncharacterized protein YlzI (FlbEa/FlbD family)
MFIEVTDISSDIKLYINKNHIVDIWQSKENCGISTTISNFGSAIYVKESYEEVKEKINA